MRVLFLPAISITLAGGLLTACTTAIDYPVASSDLYSTTASALQSEPAAKKGLESLPASKSARNIEPVRTQTFVQDMLSAVNKTRARGADCGGKKMPPVAALTWNKKLQQAAFIHSNNMAKNDFFSHQGLDGKSSSQRISDAGYHWRAAGENIAAGAPDVTTVVAGWLASPGHCLNMMSADFTEMAAALVTNNSTDYKHYWTQVFAAPF